MARQEAKAEAALQRVSRLLTISAAITAGVTTPGQRDGSLPAPGLVDAHLVAMEASWELNRLGLDHEHPFPDQSGRDRDFDAEAVVAIEAWYRELPAAPIDQATRAYYHLWRRAARRDRREPAPASRERVRRAAREALLRSQDVAAWSLVAGVNPGVQAPREVARRRAVAAEEVDRAVSHYEQLAAERTSRAATDGEPMTPDAALERLSRLQTIRAALRFDALALRDAGRPDEARTLESDATFIGLEAGRIASDLIGSTSSHNRPRSEEEQRFDAVTLKRIQGAYADLPTAPVASETRAFYNQWTAGVQRARAARDRAASQAENGASRAMLAWQDWRAFEFVRGLRPGARVPAVYTRLTLPFRNGEVIALASGEADRAEREAQRAQAAANKAFAVGLSSMRSVVRRLARDDDAPNHDARSAAPGRGSWLGRWRNRGRGGTGRTMEPSHSPFDP